MKRSVIFFILIFVISSFKNAEIKQTTQLKKTDAVTINEIVPENDLIKKKGCTLCHNIDKNVVGPSFKNISIAYNADYKKILSFFEGKTKPIVEPKDYIYMVSVLKQLKKMKPEEREEIAKYIVSLK